MSGNRSFFSELKECAFAYATFRDGANERILAKGNSEKYNLPYLNDVQYVEELKANLISLSQLCDQCYIVNFSKDNCLVTDSNKIIFMHGSRQADNCYHWISNNSDVCHSIKEDQTQLWHKKLGHAHLSCIDKAKKDEAVIKIPNIDLNSQFFCDDYQLGKQIKASHKSLKECYTNKVLEFLHMDLMGPM